MVYDLNLNYFLLKFVLRRFLKYTDKIVHGSCFKEAYSLLGEYKLKITYSIYILRKRHI